MPLSRARKEELVTQYGEGVADAPHAFVIGYQGISVPQDTELRSKVRAIGGSYEVVKNTLMLRAIEGKPLGDVKEAFTGPTAVAYSTDDAVALAKALTEFAKTVPVLEFKIGVVEGQVVQPEKIRDIAELPSRDELIAKLLFLLQSPITRLVRGLAAIPRQFVVVLDQVARQKQ